MRKNFNLEKLKKKAVARLYSEFNLPKDEAMKITIDKIYNDFEDFMIKDNFSINTIDEFIEKCVFYFTITIERNRLIRYYNFYQKELRIKKLLKLRTNYKVI